MDPYGRWILEAEVRFRDRVREDDIDHVHRQKMFEDDVAYRERIRRFEEDIVYRRRHARYEDHIAQRKRRAWHEEDPAHYERMHGWDIELMERNRRWEIEERRILWEEGPRYRERMVWNERAHADMDTAGGVEEGCTNEEWDIEVRERLSDENPRYRERRIWDESAYADMDAAEGVEEGWNINEEWEDDMYETEDWNTYEEWGVGADADDVDEGWNTCAGYGMWNSGPQWHDNEEECDYMDKDSNVADNAGEMETKIETMLDEAPPPVKVKRAASIPFCYTGPPFNNEYNEYVVQVTPVTYMDLLKPAFKVITSNAHSFRIIIKSMENSCPDDGTLKLMVKSEKMRALMKGILLLKFGSPALTISIEQREAEDSNTDMSDEESSPTYFPTVLNKVSFKIDSTNIRTHSSQTSASLDNRGENGSTLYLHNLPISVKATFLRMLFPLCQTAWLVEGEHGSAAVQMSSPKMAVLHQACIEGLQVNGQVIQLKTDVPQHEAVHMLQETVQTSQETKQNELQGLMGQDSDIAKVKRKKLSPSDIRRRLKRSQEYMERISRASLIPEAPAFPGIPSLLSVSLPGPGNTVSGAQKGASASFASSDSTPDDFPFVPIPQLLEPPPALPPGSHLPGTSERIRSRCYYRRRGARVAVHLCHLWGGDVSTVGKILADSVNASKDADSPKLTPHPDLLSVTPLKETQLQALRKKIKEQVTMDEMRKAEEHWQRKRKNKEGLDTDEDVLDVKTGGQKTKTQTRIQRDRQRMTEFNKKKNALIRASQQGNASTGSSGNCQTVASVEKHDQSFKGNAVSGQEAKKAPSGKPQHSNLTAHQPTQPPAKQDRSGGQDQSAKRSSHPPPPKPFQPSQKQYPRPSAPVPSSQGQSSRPPPPRGQSFRYPPPQGQSFRPPPQIPAPSSQGPNFRPPPPQNQNFHPPPPQGQSFHPSPQEFTPSLQGKSFRPPLSQGQSFRPPLPPQDEKFCLPPPQDQNFRLPPSPQDQSFHPLPSRGQNSHSPQQQDKSFHSSSAQNQSFNPPPPQGQSFYPPPRQGQRFHSPSPKPTEPHQHQNFCPPSPKSNHPPQDQSFNAPPLPPPIPPPMFAPKDPARQNQVSTGQPSDQQHQRLAYGRHGQGQHTDSWRSPQSGADGGPDSSHSSYQAQPRQQNSQGFWQSAPDLPLGSGSQRWEDAGNCQQGNTYQHNYEQYQ